MKRSVKSLILLGLLAALLGSYGLVEKMNQQARVSEEAGSFSLTGRSAEELTGLSWTNDAQYSFAKEESGWVNADDADFPVDQDALSELAERLATMEATRKLTGVETLEDYGFGEDSFRVTARWSDGESTVYILGDETPFADGYYARIDGEEGVVYTMSSSLSAMFAETAMDLAKWEEIGSVETATTLAIGDEVNLVRHDESISLNPDQRWYDAGGEPMDDEAVESLVADVEALAWQELIAVNADEDALAGYGLDEESAKRISLSGDDGDALELLIGGTDEEGAYYARLPESFMVYTLDAQSVEAVTGCDADSLWNGEIFPLEYENVAQFSCKLDGAEMIFEPAAEDADAETDETDPAEALWSQIFALYASGRSDAQPSGEALLEIGVNSADGMELTCSFYSYDVESYLAVTSKGRGMLVSADDVDRLIRAVKQS